MYIYKYKVLVDFNLTVTKLDRQTAKFNSLPKFSVYVVVIFCLAMCIIYAYIVNFASHCKSPD